MTSPCAPLMLAVTSLLLVAADATHDPETTAGGIPPAHQSPLMSASPTCPPASFNVQEHYRALVAYLTSQDIRHVVQLQDRPECPDAAILQKVLWKQRLKRRVAGSVEEVVGILSTKGNGKGWAVIAQSGIILEQTLRANQAELSTDVYWYLPEQNSNEVLLKIEDGKFKIITTRSLPSDWTMNDHSHNYMNESASSNLIASEGSSGSQVTAVIRYVPPRPLGHSSHITVLRNSPWIVLGTLRRNEKSFKTAGAIFVLRSRLTRYLADNDISCGSQWSARISGRDPLSGATVAREVTEEDMPAVVATQSSRPLELTMGCGESVVMRCTVSSAEDECEKVMEEDSRRHRRSAYDEWVPVNRYHHETTTAKQQVYSNSAASGRAHNYEQATYQQNDIQDQNTYHSGNSYHTDHTARANTHNSNHQYYNTHHPYNYNHNTVDSPYYPQRRAYNRRGQYNNHYRQNRFPTPQRSQRRVFPGVARPNKFTLNTFPAFVTCGGAVTGCGLCVILLEALDSTTPTSCIGPCSLGTSSACAGALGSLWKELKSQQNSDSSANHHYSY